MTKMVFHQTTVSSPNNVPGNIEEDDLFYYQAINVLSKKRIKYSLNEIKHNAEQWNGRFFENVTIEITFQILIDEKDFDKALMAMPINY